MTHIIAGRFPTSAAADDAIRALAAKDVADASVSVFYVTPPGQHDATAVGGDEHKSAGLESAGGGAGTGVATGAVAGIAAGALIGATAGLAAPIVAAAGIAAAGAGAYGGSLAGAMGAATKTDKSNIRHAGMMVAVDADAANIDVVSTLRASGALDIEEADGVWADGTWRDFDPTEPPHLIDGTVPASVSNPAGAA
jgi:hypothetical protein